MAGEVQTKMERRTIPNHEIFLVGRSLSNKTFWGKPVKNENAGECKGEYI